MHTTMTKTFSTPPQMNFCNNTFCKSTDLLFEGILDSELHIDFTTNNSFTFTTNNETFANKTLNMLFRQKVSKLFYTNCVYFFKVFEVSFAAVWIELQVVDNLTVTYSLGSER